jgi:UDP-N-acetylmuramyl pentapeptide phosphotransferase/UDP-N-acetylglucosamine-1-phosphate transferase
MGDVGGAFLGPLLAVLPPLLSPRPTLWTVMLPLWPFVIDTAITLVRRRRRGESLMVAHRSHLHQRLATADCSPAGVAWLYGAPAGLGAVVALVTVTRGVPSLVPVLTLMVVGSTLLWVLTARAGARVPRRPSLPTRAGSSRA